VRIYVAFLILSGLLLWTVIYARGPWLAKLALILTVPAYGLFVWHSVEQWKGYPVDATPPAQALYVASLTKEPEAIYLWLIPPSTDEPRAYVVPYSRQLHQQMQQAGEIQKRSRGQARISLRRNNGLYRLYQLPAVLPAKEGR